jgi:hypothetical protein
VKHRDAELQPAPNDDLERWAGSKRANNSKTDKDDATLIGLIQLAARTTRPRGASLNTPFQSLAGAALEPKAALIRGSRHG